MRYLYILLFLCAISYANSDLDSNDSSDIRDLTRVTIVQIDSISKDKDNVIITFPNAHLKVGEVGVIYRDLESYKVMVADAEIISIDGASATARVSPLSQLKQPYLPTPRLTAAEGDKVAFRSFNNKAFIIAPNEETYKSIREKYPYIDFINSDLLMGYLNSRGKHDPTKKTLPAACSEYAVGLAFVVHSDGLSVLDCKNLKELYAEKMDIDKGMEVKSPFYTRVHFDGGGSLTYIFASKKSKKDYFGYYDSLVRENNGK